MNDKLQPLRKRLNVSSNLVSGSFRSTIDQAADKQYRLREDAIGHVGVEPIEHQRPQVRSQKLVDLCVEHNQSQAT